MLLYAHQLRTKNKRCVQFYYMVCKGATSISLVFIIKNNFLILALVGYHTSVCSDSFAGASIRAMEEEVSNKVDMYVNMIQQSAEECEDEGVICAIHALLVCECVSHTLVAIC